MTAMLAPPALVAAPARSPLPFGLFSVVALRPVEGRWEAGVQWEESTTAPVGGTSFDCTIPEKLNFDTASGDVSSASPFTVYGYFRGNPVGFTPSAAQARAVEHLQLREEARVEKALWTGDLGNTPNFQAFADEAVPAGLNVRRGIAALEAWHADHYGAAGVLHLTRQTAAIAVAGHACEVRNGRLVTALGTPVVAGAGYPGTSPAGTDPAPEATWAYMTGPLVAYRSEVFVPTATPGDTLDRGVNSLLVTAERTYAVGFDMGSAGAVSLDLTT